MDPVKGAVDYKFQGLYAFGPLLYVNFIWGWVMELKFCGILGAFCAPLFIVVPWARLIKISY